MKRALAFLAVLVACAVLAVPVAGAGTEIIAAAMVVNTDGNACTTSLNPPCQFGYAWPGTAAYTWKSNVGYFSGSNGCLYTYPNWTPCTTKTHVWNAASGFTISGGSSTIKVKARRLCGTAGAYWFSDTHSFPVNNGNAGGTTLLDFSTLRITSSGGCFPAALNAAEVLFG